MSSVLRRQRRRGRRSLMLTLSLSLFRPGTLSFSIFLSLFLRLSLHLHLSLPSGSSSCQLFSPARTLRPCVLSQRWGLRLLALKLVKGLCPLEGGLRPSLEGR